VPKAGRPRSRAALASSAVLLTVATHLAGCAAAPAVSRFTLITRVPRAVPSELLERGVEGRACFTRSFVRVLLTPPWRARLADPSLAVADALARVPGANVLTNVSVRTRVEQYLLFQRTCAIVVGNAGRIR
jgi:hypothetical protein